jgi:hypothetical protein
MSNVLTQIVALSLRPAHGQKVIGQSGGAAPLPSSRPDAPRPIWAAAFAAHTTVPAARANWRSVIPVWVRQERICAAYAALREVPDDMVVIERLPMVGSKRRRGSPDQHGAGDQFTLPRWQRSDRGYLKGWGS